MMSSSWWASSITASSCSGSSTPAHGEVEAVEVEVHDDDVGLQGPVAGRLREADAPRWGSGTRRGTRARSTLTALHARSEGSTSSSARSPVRLVAAQVDELQQLLGGGSLGHAVERELALVLAGRHELVEPLHAEVVGATLQHRPRRTGGRGAPGGTGGPCRPAGPAGPWWRWPRRCGGPTGSPARGRRASCRCPCRPARRRACARRCRAARRRPSPAGPSRASPPPGSSATTRSRAAATASGTDRRYRPPVTFLLTRCIRRRGRRSRWPRGHGRRRSRRRRGCA